MYTKKPFEHQDRIADDPKDRRISKRRHLIYYLKVWDRDSGELLGHVVDITTDGLMLISEQPIPLERDYHLEIRWKEPGAGDHTLAVEARSMWAGNDLNPSYQDTGFQLLNAPIEVLQPIRELITRYGFHD